MGDYTIDELARVSGVTVRNIRAHQSRGLLPPPRVRGRTGYYGDDHLARLRLIVELQADGLNLAAIRRTLQGTPPGTAGEALDLRRALLEPWAEEASEIVTADELAERFGGQNDELLARAVRRGLVTPLGEDRVEVRSPSLLAAAEELVNLGVPLATVLDVEDSLARHADGIARLFTSMFLGKVWAPFEEAGKPEDEWHRIREAFERLRPLALRAVVVTVGASLERHVARAVDRTMLGDSSGR